MIRAGFRRGLAARLASPPLKTFVVDDGDPDELRLITIIARPGRESDDEAMIRDLIRASGHPIVEELDTEAELEAFSRTRGDA